MYYPLYTFTDCHQAFSSGAHQMEPPSPLISWVNPFPSRVINRTACFPRKVSYFIHLFLFLRIGKRNKGLIHFYCTRGQCAPAINYLTSGPFVQKVDNAIYRINLYPLDSAIGFPNTYPLHRFIRSKALCNVWTTGSGAIRHQDMKVVCYQMFHNSTSLEGGTIDMLSNISYTRLALMSILITFASPSESVHHPGTAPRLFSTAESD